ncbi:c-type cytochrome [Aestuariivirga sp.]|uniref:c-type cytochrome n=1 Tax=Aestuariivirga sp. TaxID=2650926 RepID=UPI00359425C7
MKYTMTGTILLTGLVAMAGTASAAEVSVMRGEQVSIFAGCHDCHTAGYNESGGKIDPAAALKGTGLGWQGPWGTTYPSNLRLIAKDKGSEDAWVNYAKTFQAKPPMPFFNVHAMDESDVRSLYQYIVSLGEPGEAVPEYVPPGQEPKTPYIVIVPPIMPKG